MSWDQSPRWHARLRCGQTWQWRHTSASGTYVQLCARHMGQRVPPVHTFKTFDCQTLFLIISIIAARAPTRTLEAHSHKKTLEARERPSGPGHTSCATRPHKLYNTSTRSVQTVQYYYFDQKRHRRCHCLEDSQRRQARLRDQVITRRQKVSLRAMPVQWCAEHVRPR